MILDGLLALISHNFLLFGLYLGHGVFSRLLLSKTRTVMLY